MVYHVNRERELPWEEMPPTRARPVGPSAVWQLDPSTLRFRTTLHVSVTGLQRRWADGRVEPVRSMRLAARLRYDGPRRRVRVDKVELFRELAGGGTVEAGWPDGPGSFVVPSAVLASVARFLGTPMRQGDADGIAIDSRRFPALGRLRDVTMRGWAGYAVRELKAIALRIDLKGGALVEGDPVPPAARRFVHMLVPRGDRIERIRLTWRGELRANHRRGTPFRLPLTVSFEVTAVRKGASYVLSGELSRGLVDWVYRRP